MTRENSDFWWLPEKEDINRLLTGLGHREIINERDDPRLADWWFSEGPPSLFHSGGPLHPISYLHTWRQLWNNTEIYRSLKLVRDEKGRIVGPFLLDIDSTHRTRGNQTHDIEDALLVAKRCLGYLLEKFNLTQRDYRVFFSGRKGFSIEVRPESIGAPNGYRQRLRFFDTLNADITAEVLGQANKTEKGTMIDKVLRTETWTGESDLHHPFLRIHNSINSWTDATGRPVHRMKIEVEPDRIGRIDASEVIRESEARAQAFLGGGA